MTGGSGGGSPIGGATMREPSAPSYPAPSSASPTSATVVPSACSRRRSAASISSITRAAFSRSRAADSSDFARSRSTDIATATAARRSFCAPSASRTPRRRSNSSGAAADSEATAAARSVLAPSAAQRSAKSWKLPVIRRERARKRSASAFPAEFNGSNPSAIAALSAAKRGAKSGRAVRLCCSQVKERRRGVAKTKRSSGASLSPATAARSRSRA